eukprot:4156434-Pleurochrysis_carterae.AAC.1
MQSVTGRKVARARGLRARIRGWLRVGGASGRGSHARRSDPKLSERITERWGVSLLRKAI